MSDEPPIPKQFKIDGNEYLLWVYPKGDGYLPSWGCRGCHSGNDMRSQNTFEAAEQAAMCEIETHHTAEHVSLALLDAQLDALSLQSRSLLKKGDDLTPKDLIQFMQIREIEREVWQRREEAWHAHPNDRRPKRHLA